MQPPSTVVCVVALVLASLTPACSEPTDGSPAPETLDWSRLPPAGLTPEQVPQFVAVTYDDNFVSGLGLVQGGMSWALDLYSTRQNPAGSGNPETFDGLPAKTTFYFTTLYAARDLPTKQIWHEAIEQGHEAANHTHSHADGLEWTVEEWEAELSRAQEWLTKEYAPRDPAAGVGADPASVIGFRAPFLSYNDALFSTLGKLGLRYDTSIEACWHDDEDGSNCAFPYTLHQGSPDNQAAHEKFAGSFGFPPLIENHAELWEMPVSALFVPPDELASTYDFEPGLRERIPDLRFYERSSGKISPLDITLFVDGAMTAGEVLATLKYSLDLRLAGNRAPFVFVAHTHVYASDYDAPPASTYTERQQAIAAFIDYALSKPEVRVRPVVDILKWMQNPAPLTPQ